MKSNFSFILHGCLAWGLRIVVPGVPALALAAVPAPLAAQQSSPDDLRKTVEELRAEVARLKSGGADQARLAELERRIDLLAAELEKARTGGATEVEVGIKGEPGFGPAASKVYKKAKGVSIGGYGEA